MNVLEIKNLTGLEAGAKRYGISGERYLLGCNKPDTTPLSIPPARGAPLPENTTSDDSNPQKRTQ